jgi:DNA-binding transcriptional MerR regulator
MDSPRIGSLDVARLAGVTQRMLQWWDERSIVSPRQEKHARLYSMQQVLEVFLIAELRRKGIALLQIRAVLASYRRRRDAVFVVVEPNGRSALAGFYADESALIENILRRTGACVVIDLRPAKELMDELCQQQQPA